MIESTIADIESAGWTISWAFQFKIGEWRASIIQDCEGGYICKCCLSAPTLGEALEEAFLSEHVMMNSMNTELWSAVKGPEPTIEYKQGSLLDRLGLAKPKEPIKRRI